MKEKYGTPEYDLENAKKEIDKALEKISSIRNDIGSIMEVKTCPNLQMPSFEQAYNRQFNSSWNRYDKTIRQHVERGYELVLKEIDEFEKTIESIHKENESAIQNNVETRKKVEDFMTSIGIKKTYTTYDFPSKRSKTKKTLTHSAGFMEDIQREIKIDDGYSTRISQLKTLTRDKANNYEKLISEINKIEKEKEKQAKEEEDRRELARFQVKYETEGFWDDILEIILSKNKYLMLGHFLLMNRNDWNDGYSYVEYGLSKFDAETDIDDEIINEISNIIQNNDVDGRYFRDSPVGYDYLLGLVNDEKLMEDYNKVYDKVCHF